MSDYFYSLHMLITGRGWYDHKSWGAMDELAAQIADETQPLRPLVAEAFPKLK
jgi:hypothetical protein